MFERFTAAARAAVVQAQDQARGLGYREIGAEHLLLGVMAAPDTIAARVLADVGLGREAILGDGEAEALNTLGVDLAAVRRQAEAAFGPGALDRPTPRRRGLFNRPAHKDGHLPFTAAAKQALEQSLRQAQSLQHGYIGAEHLVLGLIAQDREPVALLLQRLGVDPGNVRARLREGLARAA